MKKLLTLATLIGLASLISCTYRITDLTMASSKNIDINKIYKIDTSKRVIGTDTKQIITVIPTGNPSIKEALDNALESSNAVALSDVAVYRKWWYIPYVYGQSIVEVEGNPVYAK